LLDACLISRDVGVREKFATFSPLIVALTESSIAS
jgi:hypothetical protein